MKYTINIAKKAQKFINKLDDAHQKRILNAIYRLPDTGDIKPMQGQPGLFRLRVGSYLILYTIDHGKLIIFVVDAGNRGDVYK